jgi:hypothetical protein
MHCPSCGEEIQGDGEVCGACGKPRDPAAKVLCDGCMGAFPGGELERVDDRRLCPLCRTREEQRRAGVPRAGHARMTRYARDFSGHEVYKAPPVSWLAVASLLSVFLCPVGFAAMGLGVVALLRIRKDPKAMGGSGFAIAGIALGALSLVVLLCMGLAFVPMYFGVRDAQQSAQVRAHMTQIRMAEEVHRNKYGEYAEMGDLLDRECLDRAEIRSDPYTYTTEVVAAGVRILATPKNPGAFSRHYLLDERGAFRSEMGKPATPESPIWRQGYRTAPRARTVPRRTSGG